MCLSHYVIIFDKAKDLCIARCLVLFCFCYTIHGKKDEDAYHGLRI